jgi:hypothetical protein
MTFIRRMTMRITTKATDLTDLDFYVMEEVNPEALEPAKAYGTDDISLVDGQPVYRLPALYVKEDGRASRSITVKFRRTPAEKIPELTKIHLTGTVVITPWLNGKRIAYSLLADGMEIVK